MNSPTQPSNPARSRRIHPATIWVPLIIIALGAVVDWNYLWMITAESKLHRLPISSRLETNLTLTESSGQQVELKDLKGKVLAACWVNIHSERGGQEVIAGMNMSFQDIRQKAGADADAVHFLSFSVDPADTPANLREFAHQLQIDTAHWWFLTGSKDSVRPYLTRYFGFKDLQEIPEKDRLPSGEKFVQDTRVALVDSMGQVRGFYDLASPDPEARDLFQKSFREDALKLLSERHQGGRSTSSLVAYLVVVLGSCGYLVWQRFKRPTPAAAVHA